MVCKLWGLRMRAISSHYPCTAVSLMWWKLTYMQYVSLLRYVRHVVLSGLWVVSRCRYVACTNYIIKIQCFHVIIPFINGIFFYSRCFHFLTIVSFIFYFCILPPALTIPPLRLLFYTQNTNVPLTFLSFIRLSLPSLIIFPLNCPIIISPLYYIYTIFIIYFPWDLSFETLLPIKFIHHF